MGRGLREEGGREGGGRGRQREEEALDVISSSSSRAFERSSSSSARAFEYSRSRVRVSHVGFSSNIARTRRSNISSA